MRNEQYNDTGASYLSGDLEGQLSEIEGSLDVRAQRGSIKDTTFSETSRVPNQPASFGKKLGLSIAASLIGLSIVGGMVVGAKATWRHIVSKSVCPPVFDFEAFNKSLSDPENIRRFREGKKDSEALYGIIKPHVEAEIDGEYKKGDFLTDLHKYEIRKRNEFKDGYTDKDFLADIEADRSASIKQFLEYSRD